MYSHLVFTGGGLTGIAYTGVIRYMQELGIHKNIHEVAGTSIGALFACLFAMDIMAGELEEYIKEFMNVEENVTFSVIQSLVNFLDTYSLDDGMRLIKPVQHFVEKMYNWKNKTISFREFVKKTGRNIIICATNINTRSGTYFSVDTTPDVCIYDALRASMTLPFLMKPVTINDQMYVDGGLCDDIPFYGFRNIKINSLLVVGTGAIVKKNVIPDNIMNYISILFQILISNNKPSFDVIKMKTNSFHHLILDDAPIPFLNIEGTEDGMLRIVINERDIDAAIAYGYIKMYEFVQINVEKMADQAETFLLAQSNSDSALRSPL